jgi:hypothetical protein
MPVSTLTETELLQQLQQLKGLTVRTGSLHEAQILQLQLWPQVAFPHAISHTAEVDTESKVVTFIIHSSLKKEPRGARHERSVDMLTKWVRTILWDDTTVFFRWTMMGGSENDGAERPSN